MDEPVKVKYVPLEAVEKLIKEDFCLGEWAKEELYQMAEKYGIDAVEYKCCVSVRDYEASMFDGYSSFTVEGYTKKRASEWLSECIDRHIKCTGKEREPAYRATEYRYGIMIGEIPKWKQKGEDDEQRN